ncbi:lanthionine synthetase LanC family protein [Nonomuraea thailandensis]
MQEFIDGTPLQRRLVHRYPLTRATCTEQDLAEYTEWAVETLEQVARAVGSLHERGVVFGDLHPDNILLTDDGRVALIDYEVATLADDRARAALAHPAFAAPADRQGVDVDRYALACLRLGLFAPQCTIMLPLHRPKVTHLGEIVKETFPVPCGVIDEAVATIAGGAHDGTTVPMPGVAGWPELRDAMATAITAAATPGRDDRLFPGDVAQFRPGGGLNLAHGAAGVLFALHSAGLGPFPEYERWLRERARRPIQGSGLGLYDGLHGIAYVLGLLGHHEDAHDLIGICLREKWDRLESALISGLSGIGLNLLHFGHTDLALHAVDICAARLDAPVPEISGGAHPRAGLMHGSSGPALLFLHAYEHTGDPALLDLAATALRQDLRRCRHSEDGSLQVNQGWRLLPYLDEGSAGIALVLERYLRHRHDEAFATALAELRLAGRAGFFVQAGLFTGRAGLIAAGAGDLPELVKGLRWHALPYAGGLAFPGDQLLRLSMDFATGTAGVLFALASVMGGKPCQLPFLGAAPERPLPDDTTEGGVRHGTSRPAGS